MIDKDFNGNPKDEDECVDDDWLLWADASTNYAPDWYWVNKDGKTEDVIKGSGVKKKWKKYYKHLLSVY